MGVGAGCGLLIIALVMIVGSGWAGRLLAPLQHATPMVPPVAQVAATPTPLVMVTRPIPSPTVPVTASPVPTPLTPPPLGLPVPPAVDQRPIRPQAEANLAALHAAWYPPRDFYDTEARLGSRKLRGRTRPAVEYEVGSRRSIFVEQEPVDIELVYRSTHALYWADVGLSLTEADFAPIAVRLETEFFGPMIDLLGTRPIPGIDGEERIQVIHVSYRTAQELGYFDSGDQFPKEIFRFSNEHDAIYLNMDELILGERAYYGTLLHEFEHLLHWQRDPNEATWVDEGLAELMEVYFNLDTFSVNDYLDRPDIQLNSWGTEPEATYAHYAGAGLFLIYFWEQLGDAAVRDLFLHPSDGMAGVRAVLGHYRPDSSLEQFLSEFYAATYLQNDDRLGFDYWLPERPITLTYKEPQEIVHQLPQFGVDYLELDMIGEITVSFAGDTLIELYQPPSPQTAGAWLAPALNSLDATLTAEFDLRELEEATLVYQAWFELEENYDYAYVFISSDGGRTWNNLNPPLGRDAPFGRGYNGRSADETTAVGGWLDESVSLNEYVGQVVKIRFELITDAVVAERGFALNNIAVVELGPPDVSRWTAIGFVWVGPHLAQQWSVQLLRPGTTEPLLVLPLDEFNQGQWRMILDRPAVLAVAPLTPMTTQPADYWIKIERN